FDLILAHHAVDDDLEMQFAHAGNDGLARINVGSNAEGRIFLRQLGESHTHLLLVSLGLRLNGNLNNWCREVNRLEDYRVFVRADGVAGDKILETDGSTNIA